MKNIIKSLFLILVCVGFSSCNEEVGYIDPGPQGNPEKEAAGTYSGTWSRALQGTDDIVTSTGTITISAGDKAYIANVSVVCPELNLDLQSVANIVNYSEGYKYYNMEAKNGFGTTFEGSVLKSGIATIKFTIKQQEGRKQYLYTYTFSGDK